MSNAIEKPAGMTTQDACDTLNWLLQNDTRCLRCWEVAMLPVKYVTAIHPLIQCDTDPQPVENPDDRFRTSPLGILNGMLGQGKQPVVVREMYRPDDAEADTPWICTGYRPATEEEMKEWIEDNSYVM